MELMKTIVNYVYNTKKKKNEKFALTFVCSAILHEITSNSLT